jgi:hypothetical protein
MRGERQRPAQPVKLGGAGSGGDFGCDIARIGNFLGERRSFGLMLGIGARNGRRVITFAAAFRPEALDAGDRSEMKIARLAV